MSTQYLLCGGHDRFKVLINGIEFLGLLRQLLADIVGADKNAWGQNYDGRIIGVRYQIIANII